MLHGVLFACVVSVCALDLPLRPFDLGFASWAATSLLYRSIIKIEDCKGDAPINPIRTNFRESFRLRRAVVKATYDIGK